MSLVLRDVSKSYDKKVLDSVQLEMDEGVYGLLGPNGAGKSTLIRLICGIEQANTGTITYGGKDISELDEKYRELLGYVPQKTGFYEDFTAQEFLEYMALMKGLSKKKTKEQVEKMLDLVTLKDVRNKRIKTFSGGMKQRVSIAQALLNDPEILILDEPTVGLDMKERMKFKQFISEFASERIVIFATHIVSDIEDIGSQIVVMKDGRVLANDTTEHLLKTVEKKVWEVECTKKELQHLKKNGRPSINAENVEGNMQDLYLWLFDEISK